MSKNLRSSPERVHSVAGSVAYKAPVPASNAADRDRLALEDRGAGAVEFGLQGGFADTILECLPTLPAVMLAKRFAHNPAVLAWADRITLAEVASELSLAANALLREVWPVGTGLEGETELAMGVVVGGQARGQVTAVRTDLNELSTTMSTQASAAWDSVGAGISTKDAFGREVWGASAEAALRIHADIQGKKKTDFDLVSLIQNTIVGAMKLSHLLHPAGPGVMPLRVADALKTQAYENESGWDIEFAVSARGVAQAGANQVLSDQTLDDAFQGVDDDATRESRLLPLLKLSAEYGLTLGVRAEGIVLEGEVRSVQALGNLAAAPLLADALGGLSGAAMSEKFEGCASSVLRLVIPDPTVLTLDEAQSGVATTRSTVMNKDVMETEHFLSLATLSEIMTSDLTVGTALADTRKVVKINLDPRQAQAHLSTTMRQVLTIAGGVIAEDSRLYLEGEASLSAKHVRRVLGHRALQGLDRPQDLMDVAIDVAMGGDAALRPDLAAYRREIQRMAEIVKFDGARLKGSVLQGLGGGLDVAAPGGGTGGTIRAAGGIIIDKEADAEEVQKVRDALSGGQGVA